MSTKGMGDSPVSGDSEYRNKDSQGINCESGVVLDVDPFQILKHHFSSMNNCTVSVNEKNILPLPHNKKSGIEKNFQDKYSFDKALADVKVFLDKEQCSKKTADHFYALIQSVAEHVSCSKKQIDDNIQTINGIEFDFVEFTSKALDDCDKINTILNLSYTEKLWNYFTDSQKENVENFQKLFSEFYKLLNENCVKDTKLRVTSTSSSNTSKEASCTSLKNKELQQLLLEKNKLLTKLATIKEKFAELPKSNTDINVAPPYCQYQARLIGILSPFLYSHRFSGQSVSEISSYLKSLGYHINEQEIESILTSFPSLFRECQSSEEHTDVKRWTFCGCDL